MAGARVVQIGECGCRQPDGVPLRILLDSNGYVTVQNPRLFSGAVFSFDRERAIDLAAVLTRAATAEPPAPEPEPESPADYAGSAQPIPR
jgi:hypothetical protein